jgi:hypothetical protein
MHICADSLLIRLYKKVGIKKAKSLKRMNAIRWSEGDCITIKSFELASIDGKRFTKRGEKLRQIRIDHNSTVTLITEINKKEANVDFRFTANYSGMGVIKIEGRMIFEGDAPSLVKEWSTTGKMPEEVANQIHTTIMNNCIPEAVLIARDIHLPPPIPLPRVNIKKRGAPSTGVEVA